MLGTDQTDENWPLDGVCKVTVDVVTAERRLNAAPLVMGSIRELSSATSAEINENHGTFVNDTPNTIPSQLLEGQPVHNVVYIEAPKARL